MNDSSDGKVALRPEAPGAPAPNVAWIPGAVPDGIRPSLSRESARAPGAEPEFLVSSSVMFKRASGPVDLRNPYHWWVYRAGADWRHPRGPGSHLKALMDHPVVYPSRWRAHSGATIPPMSENMPSFDKTSRPAEPEAVTG